MNTYKYAVFSSNGYFEDFQPFIEYDEAKVYFDKVDNEEYQVVLLEYKEIK